MIPLEKVEELVAAHRSLPEDPTTAAVWFRRSEPALVWLFEVIPSLPEQEEPEEPIYFNPGVAFRFPIALIAGTRRSLELTLQRDPALAREVADGQILLDESGDATALVDLARHVAAA
ncbi:MAG: hypothetical protein KIT72_12675 [Polyangiaceae bacterium]|nr:hypothetical protein [Polyangiaceae bacterium]MCW5791267.1 hypothetical protein [Polyangiaceae bacterium]